jgi:hypothetical protein
VSQYDTLADFKRVSGYCSVVHERTYFHANGNVSSCCGLPEPVFGNILTASFDEVWNSPKYREFRVLNLLGFPHTGCYLCTLPYGLPAKNPANFLLAHRVTGRANLLARVVRRARFLLGAAPPPPAPPVPESPAATAPEVATGSVA